MELSLDRSGLVPIGWFRQQLGSLKTRASLRMKEKFNTANICRIRLAIYTALVGKIRHPRRELAYANLGWICWPLPARNNCSFCLPPPIEAQSSPQVQFGSQVKAVRLPSDSFIPVGALNILGCTRLPLPQSPHLALTAEIKTFIHRLGLLPKHSYPVAH